jgi:DNA-binding MarR family transcriptional regulator
MSAAKKSNQKVADQVWRALSAQVMETRDEWRRQIQEVTGLPFSRWRVLKRLREKPLTLREIVERTGADAPAMSLAVTDLEERGLVARQPHPEDRRAKLVSLTPKGKAVLAQANKLNERAPEKFAALPEKDLAELSRILAKLPL